jgi:glycosyltransferase involved in cell wall biosynthesis
VEAEGGDQEGLGLVTVEAIGCGCPVIVSDLPAVADVIQDASLRVKPADLDGLSSAIIFQMGRDRDDLRRQVEDIRRRAFDRFDWSARAENYKQLLLAAAKGP